ncbi:ribonucrease Y [Alkalispirochaeta americana]|uniref:Ribonuclease Y n=1 Tax=Alkalispirochaeta americana TaxID=159291 RepID=A0A1N6W0B6_9SPIO|nr:ribonuclease Y [Alkalispirochaeta americana]SIQ83490.1 ribonucrease Y [Alkalispirochaeta americana]
MRLLLMLALPLAGGILGWTIRWLYARFQLSSAEQRAERLRKDAVKDAEARKTELILETRDDLQRERNEQEREIRERRSELQRVERRLLQKEENLDEKASAVERSQQELANRERKLDERDKTLMEQEIHWRNEMERVSGLTQEEARKLILSSLEDEVRHDAQGIAHKIEQEAILSADRQAREILISTVQRLASEVNTEVTVSSVSLPNDEMKGRIIGREGRNIRTLETLTGVDIIIDDTPEAVVVSCFDPIRKEIAKRSLERLVSDGRIHPTRIEEVVQKVTADMTQAIYEEGEKVLYELNIHHLKPEGVRGLGRLAFRTSYGQNVLAHSKEVAVLAGSLAAEVGADVEIARRGGALHDIGKGIETDGDSNHVELGVELAKRLGEDPRVINAIAAHHGDVPHNCIESVIVQVADAISASRPGARRETLDNYIKRLENLEEIADGFEGVDKSFAIQAGRELRIMVNHEKVSDQEAREIAKKIARQIEDQLRYPGRIKVTMIRETRIVEYAR